MKGIYLCVFSVLFLSACANDAAIESKSGDIQSTIAANGENEAELQETLKAIEKEEQDRIAHEKATLTSMTFDKITQDFGKIKEDTENKASFVVTNTGKNPLIIEKVDVSCGCTTAQKPEKPIPPGKSDRIEVVFHPKVGQLNDQNKTVTVTANTDPKIVVLNIKAFVVEK